MMPSIPKLRSDSYFPDWLLEDGRRAERALIAVVAECCVKGVPTRRVDACLDLLTSDTLTEDLLDALEVHRPGHLEARAAALVARLRVIAAAS